MLLFWLLLGIFLSYISCECPIGTLEYPFVPPSKCYSFFSTKSTFSSAEASCKKTGGSLTSIHDAFTNAFIKEAASLGFQDEATSDFWIGASRSAKNSSWNWTDKSPFDFTDWKTVATNSSLNYGTMNTESGMWTTADGNLEKPFVCSVTDNSPMPSTTTTIKPLTNCPDDWYFYEDTNSCYFASDLFTWQKGEDYCASFGGHLASLHSSAERDFALSVYNGVLWLGLYTNDSTITKHTTWKWTDGSKVDFLPWYYPYLSEVKPPCIQLYGTFNYPIFMNANCTDKSYGLCKKPAATIPLPTSPPPPPQTEVKCLSGWQYLEKTNSCYSGISSGNWPNAEQYCIYLDAHLPSVHSQEEQKFINGLLYYYGGAHNGWIGLYSDNNGVSWKWVDDSPFNYRVWNTGNPTRGGNLCANIYGSYQNSDNCNGSFNYVCQRSAYKTVM